MEDTMTVLPDECWELIIQCLEDRYYESMSLVCKQFLFFTNQLRLTLSISDPTFQYLFQIFRRFPNIKHIDVSRFHGDLDNLLYQIALSGLDIESLNLSNQRSVPVSGLRELSSKMGKLKTLNCSKVGFFHDGTLVEIAESFPHLQELNISYVNNFRTNNSNAVQNSANHVSDGGIAAFALRVKSLRKVDISGNPFLTGRSLLSLCFDSDSLEEIAFLDCCLISQSGVASAIRYRPGLTSISIFNPEEVNVRGRGDPCSDLTDSLITLKGLTSIEFLSSHISDDLLYSLADACLPLKKLLIAKCSNYTSNGIYYLLSKCRSVQYLDLQGAKFMTDEGVRALSVFLRNIVSITLGDSARLTNSTFFTLTRKCPLLKEIEIKTTNLGKQDNMDEIAVNPSVESLCLSKNKMLDTKSMNNFASICPNLRSLDLSCCYNITEEGIVEVLRRCSRIRRLHLAYCYKLQNFGLDFEVPTLEVLDLSGTKVDDEALSIIGRRCCRLLQLNVSNCFHLSEEGVKEVVKNCKQLKEINLIACNKVSPDIVAWMVFSRPSLRRIFPPPGFHTSESQWKLFLKHGCLVYQS